MAVSLPLCSDTTSMAAARFRFNTVRIYSSPGATHCKAPCCFCKCCLKSLRNLHQQYITYQSQHHIQFPTTLFESCLHYHVFQTQTTIFFLHSQSAISQQYKVLSDYINYFHPYKPLNTSVVCSGGARGTAARSQIYMGAPLGVVEIHLRAKLPPL